MRKLLSVFAATMLVGTTAFADSENVAVPTPVLSGEVELTFSEQASGDWGGELGLDLGLSAGTLGTVDLGFIANDTDQIELDTWTVGTAIGSLGVALGNDNGVFVGAEGEQTLAAPAMTESIKVTVGDAAVAVGFTDWTADVTDISNIQGAYTMGNVAGLANITLAGDYNMDSENFVLGATAGGIEIAGVGLSKTVTYDVDAERLGFEGVASVMGVTAYLNGDTDDTFQNIGGEYTYNIGGAELTAGANYNIDAEDFAPTAGISFSF